MIVGVDCACRVSSNFACPAVQSVLRIHYPEFQRVISSILQIRHIQVERSQFRPKVSAFNFQQRHLALHLPLLQDLAGNRAGPRYLKPIFTPPLATLTSKTYLRAETASAPF